MADNVFVIGRDILKTFDCIIDYQNLSFNIGETSLPLLRTVASKQPSKSLNIHTSKTTIVPPYSFGSIPLYFVPKIILNIGTILVLTALNLVLSKKPNQLYLTGKKLGFVLNLRLLFGD